MGLDALPIWSHDQVESMRRRLTRRGRDHPAGLLSDVIAEAPEPKCFEDVSSLVARTATPRSKWLHLVADPDFPAPDAMLGVRPTKLEPLWLSETTLPVLAWLEEGEEALYAMLLGQSIPEVIGLKRVRQLTGLSKRQLIKKLATGAIPPPLALAQREPGHEPLWNLADVDAYLSDSDHLVDRADDV